MMKAKLLERFSKYISFPTTSDENSTSYPSTNGQLIFGDFLVEELQRIGLSKVEKDKFGYITAFLPANNGKTEPTIGFIAHIDTAPDMPGISSPRIIENYNGNDIVLEKETNTILSTRDFPELLDYKGQTILTTDSKTLLGADDKAGVTEIVSAMEHLIQHPEIKHYPIKVAFTPDEEIGQGVKFFDVKKFGCNFAYTIDGGATGELEYENFNAASAEIIIQGKNIHPGYAKGKMLNSQYVAMELNGMLPATERPEHTENREGFFHLTHIEGDVELTKMHYIIREHDSNKFIVRKQLLQKIVDSLNKKHENCIACKIEDQYRNMREKIEPVMYIVERAEKAMELAGIKPKIQPIRGGTDGANLSFKGLPCPNIFTGGHNFHGKYEFISLESMVKATEIIINIATL